jgi:hypothetical protein
MTDPVLAAFTLAGFLFAQARDVANNGRIAVLTPVAIVVEGEQQRFQLFPGNTADEMVENGREALEKSGSKVWAFAYEGYALEKGHKRSAIFIEASNRSPAMHFLLVQYWERDADRNIVVHGAPRKLSSTAESLYRSTASSEPIPLTDVERRAFESGVSQQQALRKKGYLGPSPSQ